MKELDFEKGDTIGTIPDRMIPRPPPDPAILALEEKLAEKDQELTAAKETAAKETEAIKAELAKNSEEKDALAKANAEMEKRLKELEKAAKK